MGDQGSKRKEKTILLQKGHEIKKGEGKTHEPYVEKREDNTRKEKPQLGLTEYKESNQTEDMFAPTNRARINNKLTRSKTQPILMPRSKRKQIQNSSVDKTKKLERRRNRA